MDCIVSKFKFDPAKACMVGDRLDTDIAFGIEGGLGGTLLVLTGVSKESEITGPKTAASILPDYYMDCFGDILHAL